MMNNEEFEELATKFTRAIKDCVIDFFTENIMHEEYDTSDIINLLLSAHVGSMICTTEVAAKDLDKGNHEIRLFNEKLLDFIASSSSIEKIKTIRDW